MKTRLVGVLVSLILLNACSTVENDSTVVLIDDNDLKGLNLNGQVKSIKRFTYDAVDKFGEITKGKKQILGTFADYSFSYFNGYILINESGNKTVEEFEENWYNTDSNYLKQTTYKYNNMGYLIEKDSHSSAEIDSSDNRKYTYKYDYQGNKIEMNLYNSEDSLDMKVIYKYDYRGNKIEMNWYNSDGSISYMDTYKYDVNGNLIEQSDYYSDGSIRDRDTYKYDVNGNRIEYALDWYGRKYTYKYDNKRNLIEMIIYNSDGSVHRKETYEYEYDKKNNWIKKNIFINKIPKYILEREIEYYE